VVLGDDLTQASASGRVLIDVTTLIGAEDYIASQNRRARPRDPFARQCFVELVQSLVFMERVCVPHPTLANPRPADFGSLPHLLQALMRRDLVHPLQLDEHQWTVAQSSETAALQDLTTSMGTGSIIQFIDQALICDSAGHSASASLSARLTEWARFQAAQVRVTGHHHARINTGDGIESDAYGEWARSAAVVLHRALQPVAPPGEGKYLMATLARGLRYRARAEAATLCYQPHPIRRDFSVTFDLNRRGVDRSLVLEVIKAVRGIHDSIAQAAGQIQTLRVRLLEFELPLLGGRLWRDSETAKRGDPDWIEVVADRIGRYREAAADLRAAIASCLTEEDHLRLARDLEGVRNSLLEALGFRRTETSPLERELVDGVASVTQTVTGVPVVSGLYLGTREVAKGVVRRFRGRPFEQFLYREFIRAWKLTGS
jgi:hypothetical protein